MPAACRESIDRFLSLNRIAFIGLSSKPSDFSRQLFREFVAHCYDVVPVNPKLTQIEGRRCYEQVGNISPAVEGALVMTSADTAAEIVSQCAAAGVKRVWLYRAAGKGSVSEAALQTCDREGIDVVAGECPFMFLSKPGFPHNLHGFVRKLAGTYPS